MLAATDSRLIAVLLSVTIGWGLAACRRATIAPEPAREQPSSSVVPSAAARWKHLSSIHSALPVASDPEGAPDEQAPSGGPPAPEELNEGCKFRKNSRAVVSCTAAEGNLGDWRPTRREMHEVMRLADGSCSCASRLEPLVQACIRMQNSTTVSLTVGRSTEATDCSLRIKAGEWEGRRFVVIDAVNRDQATFYRVNHVIERTDKGLRLYVAGFNGLPGEAEVAKGGDGVSPEMQREWPTLPAELKAFFDSK